MPTGFRTSAAIQDLNSNGHMDLLIGNFSGGLNYFPDISQPNVSGINDSYVVANNILEIYPNPGFDNARIRYRIPDTGYLIMDLYSVSGMKIERLIEERKSPGKYNYDLDLRKLPAGIYLVRLQSGSIVNTKKLVVVK